VFFAERARENVWQVLCKPGRRIRPGDKAVFGSRQFVGTFQESLGADLHLLELESVDLLLERFGEIPLPPYLEREPTVLDESNYQTVFGNHPGAVAAPTAGLHFTESAFEVIRSRGVTITTITLHVGIGTFLPIRTEEAEQHILRPERYEVHQDAADLLQAAVREKRRVIAVGTTSTRTLEYLMQRYGEIRSGSGHADLYILPGFEFRIVDALLTNFHLPRSTLLMLVSAFSRKDLIFKAYMHAIDKRYRFYSYGDCMLIFR
jgi:S-adenosylmethionine:tRNA ribosyltransferase-isomerase